MITWKFRTAPRCDQPPPAYGPTLLRRPRFRAPRAQQHGRASGADYFSCCFGLVVRSYHDEHTTSHPNCEVKHRWARVVLQWGTMGEYRVLYGPAINFFFLYNISAPIRSGTSGSGPPRFRRAGWPVYAGVSSDRTNLSPFTKDYRGLALSCDFALFEARKGTIF